MSKKKKIIIVCVSLFVLLQIIGLGGRYLMEKRFDRNFTLSLCDLIDEHMKSDENFEALYGEVVSVTYYEEYERENLPSRHYRVPCKVETATETYLVWVNFLYSPTEKSISYDSITLFSEVG